MSTEHTAILVEPERAGEAVPLTMHLPLLLGNSGLTPATVHTLRQAAGGDDDLLAGALLAAWSKQRRGQLEVPFRFIRWAVTENAKNTPGWAENLIEEGELQRITEFQAAGETLMTPRQQQSEGSQA